MWYITDSVLPSYSTEYIDSQNLNTLRMSRVNTIQSNPVSTDTERAIESVCTINRVSILNLEKNRKSFPGTMQTVCNNEVSLLGGFRLYSQAKDKIRWYIMRLLIFMPCKTFWHLECDTINFWLEVFASSSFSIEGLFLLHKVFSSFINVIFEHYLDWWCYN